MNTAVMVIMMPEVFTYTFMQRAFLVGNMIALIAPLIGVFLIMKGLSQIGHTISHVALAGVALGILTGIYPVYPAILVSILAALGIEKIREKISDYAELSLSIILAAGMGIATILISLSDNSIGIMSYLFGSLTLVSELDLMIVIPMAVIIIVLVFLFYSGFFYLSFNEGDARLAGVPVKLLNILFMIIISITISLSLRIVGGLLIASLISIPVATGLQLARSFKETILYSILAALLSVNSGLITAYYLDLAPGGTVILLSVFYFLLAAIIKYLRERKGVQ